MKAASKTVIDVTTKKYVREGPALYVSKLLHQKGCLSSKKIWDEYIKDPNAEKGLLPSKSYLKDRILAAMKEQGKLVKGRSIDVPQYSKSGWVVVPHKAFKNVAPDILAEMQPLPAINR